MLELKRIVLSDKETFRRVILLKETNEVTPGDDNAWKVIDPAGNHDIDFTKTAPVAITHPALYLEKVEIVTPHHITASLNAADQLRQLILRAAQ